MKQIRLNHISLQNFKGIKDYRLDLPEAGNATIKGANGTGKSTLMDAYLWCLFGRDSQGRTNYEIKHLGSDGKSQPKVDAVVELGLLLDGERITLERRFSEKWRKPRGQSEQVFDGNTTEYLYNSVPLSEKEYNERVARLIDPTLFGLLTNPEYFTSLDWKKQRELLFSLTTQVTDADIATTRAEFADLLNRLSGKTLSDYRRELKSKRGRLKDELDSIAPRIDQTRKLTPEAEDWDDLEAQQADLEANIKRAEASILQKNKSLEEKHQEANREAERVASELKALRTQQAQVEADARIAEQKRVDEANRERKEHENALTECRHAERMAKLEIGRIGAEMDELKSQIRLQENILESLRGHYVEKAQSRFPSEGGEIRCPLYGFVCNHPEAKVAQSQQANEQKRRWIVERDASLEAMKDEAERIKGDIASKQERLSQLTDKAQEAEAKLAQIQATAKTCEEHHAHLPELQTPKAINPEDLPEWQELEVQIQRLRHPQVKAEVFILPNEENPIKLLESQRKAWQTELDAIKLRLNNRVIIARNQAEIERLTQLGRKLGEDIAGIEREEDIAREFTKAKIDESANRINALFEDISFRLFEYTQEGNEVEVCRLLIDGVPYGSANTASQINAGLELIEVFSRHHGITAPIFIDNRERVTEIRPTTAQTISLEVNPTCRGLVLFED